MSSSGPPSEGDDHHQNHNHNKWDVFLSFRGEDIRNTFVDHLYSALEKSWIKTFKDDEKLERGESISPALLKSIEESIIAVVVFSENYASSKWCLNELVQIMDCYSSCRSDSSNSSSMGLTSQKLIVIPIFYHVDPSHVRHSIEKEYIGPNFISEHGPAKVKIWSDALQMAGKLAGHVLNNGRENQFIDTIVSDIWSKLPITISSEHERLVGMESRIEEVTSLLDAESDAVRVVGIWGLGGIGKTTLARAVFDRMKSQFQYRFEATCFLEQVGEKRRQKHLEEQLVKQLVNDLKINNDWDRGKIMSRLRGRKVLLVLDDIDDVDKHESSSDFVRKLRLSFGGGSKILITTRNKHSLTVHQVDAKYEAKLLNDGEATRLLSWMANIHPIEEFEHLSYEVVRYASGLPLALKVLGSALRGRDLKFWEASLKELRKEGPGGDILKKLRIGFDGLEPKLQETFLDIACFFEGQEKEHVTRILDSFDFNSDYSIPLLVDKSLIYVRYNKLVMHNLIREMGRSINSENPRRLWRPNDFERLLKCSEGAENIVGILRHPSALERKYMGIPTKLLRKMSKLRLLVIRDVRARQAPKYLPGELRWLIWDEFPSESLPPMFEAYNLVGLELHRSSIKRLWMGKEMMDKLKYIDLAFSPLIKTTPDFTVTPNLEKLNLSWCHNLEVVHQSVGALEKLVELRLDDCRNLKTFPKIIRSKYLQTLGLRWCQKLQKFPEISVIMERLKSLDLSHTAIRELPSSIEHLPNLSDLNLMGCKNLRCLPSAICRLKRLEYLSLSGCSALDKLPSSIKLLSSLNGLILSDCKNLRSLPSAICRLKCLRYLFLSRCSKLEKLPEELGSLGCLAKLHLEETAVTQLPFSIQNLNNLRELLFGKSSQSSTSTFQFPFTLKRKRQEDNSTRSLVLLPVFGLRSLQFLYLNGCNMFPSALESLYSLSNLYLGGNCFVELPSLNKLSRLSCLSLDGCKMLKALPELPSSIEVLSADDCPSLRLCVNQITNSRKLYYISFRNCLQLLKEYNRESKNIAISILWQQMIKVDSRVTLPGGDIPEWFGKPTKGGHSISLKLPSNWSRDNFMGFGFCVAYDPKYKAPLFGRREKDVGGHLDLEFTATTPSNRQYRQILRLVTKPYIVTRSLLKCRDPYRFCLYRHLIIGDDKNISMEHVCLYYISLYSRHWQNNVLNGMNDWCEVEFSIKNSSRNIASVTQWGMVLEQYDGGDDDDDDDDRDSYK